MPGGGDFASFFRPGGQSFARKSCPRVHVPNFGGFSGRRTGVGVTTVSNSLILGGWVTKVLKNGDKKYGGGRVGDNSI